jgi:hypothetical protein
MNQREYVGDPGLPLRPSIYTVTGRENFSAQKTVTRVERKRLVLPWASVASNTVF